MGTDLIVLQPRRDLVPLSIKAALPALPGRPRRAVMIAGVNVLAIGLAFGALRIAGVMVGGGHDPLIGAVDPREDALVPTVAAPLPRPAPAFVAAAAGADVLFAPPVIEPAAFTAGPPPDEDTAFGGGGQPGIAPQAAVADPAAPVSVSPAPDPVPGPRPAPARIASLGAALPPVARIVGVAERGAALAANLAQRTTAPLVEVADNSLDLLGPGGRADVGGGGNASAGGPGGSAGVGAAVGASTQSVTQAAAQATHSVTQTVSGVVSALGGALR